MRSGRLPSVLKRSWALKPWLVIDHSLDVNKSHSARLIVLSDMLDGRDERDGPVHTYRVLLWWKVWSRQ
jgi:hypothetical protein